MRNGEGNGYWVTDAYKRLYGSPGEKQEYMYYGEWKDNKPHGKGTLYEYAGSDVLIEVLFYEGEFKDGYFHGYGVKYDFVGSIEYEGKFEKGEYVGD